MRPSDYNTHHSCYTRTPSKSNTLNNKRKDAINLRRDKRRPAPMYIVTARVVTLRMQNKIQFGFQRPKNHTHLQKQHSGVNGSHFIYTQNAVSYF